MADDRGKILIVDDDQALLTFLSNILRSANYEVISTTRGKEAIDLAKNLKPDLIILDILLPDIMGGEVSQILSQDPSTYKIPIIFLTGLNTKEDEKIIKKTGNFHLLAKPVTREDLLDAISKVLSEVELF
ncbi:MAG: response regulator [Candidatus Omnitrophota bacterium]|nr:MAG: response regulator [Candidatus Omnitrophota bacterium]